MIKNLKAQTSGGLITGLVFGIASLVIGVIIAFVIVSTLTGADLLTSGRTTTSVVNETGGYINDSGYQLTGLDANFISDGITITYAYNSTGLLITAPNYTVSSIGLVTSATSANWSSTNFTYTSTVYANEEVSETALTANFTAGVDNVSEKIPTVLLVAAIVLILGVLVLLVAAWQRMQMGGGSI